MVSFSSFTFLARILMCHREPTGTRSLAGCYMLSVSSSAFYPDWNSVFIHSSRVPHTARQELFKCFNTEHAPRILQITPFYHPIKANSLKRSFPDELGEPLKHDNALQDRASQRVHSGAKGCHMLSSHKARPPSAEDSAINQHQKDSWKIPGRLEAI